MGVVSTELGPAREPGGQLTSALAAGGVGTWQWDRRTEEVRWDSVLEALFGLWPGEFGGTLDDWLDLVHPDDRTDALAAVEASLANGGELVLEHRIIRPDGGQRWLHCRGEVLTDDGGEPVKLHGVAVDFTDRRAIEAERDRLLAAEQAARDRLAFLAQASTLLARSLNAGAAMGELADLAVPRLGDWCLVDVLDDRGELQLIAVSHRDPDKVARLRQWRVDNAPAGVHGPGQVARTGVSELLTEVTDTVLQRVAADEADLQLLRSLQLRSLLAVPIKARGTVLGALTLLCDADSDRRHTREDLTLAEDLAIRAGIALDNARLFQQRAEVANVLQRALLPPALPEVPGAELAARHQPAAEMVIGGDFYDLFENADGTWTVLIGDVSGKDTTAASLTALARHSARAAVARDADPRSVLGVVNHAFRHQSSIEQFCTAVCARLRPGDGPVRLDVAVAGHPRPLVLRADGTVEPVQVFGQLVGLIEESTRSIEEVTLAPGETLVLYTDGVVEARHGDELFGHHRLAAALHGRQGLGAGALADEILRAVTAFDGGERRDDIAVLTLQASR